MAPRTIVIAAAGLAVAVGIPLYYVVLKKHAAATLEDLIAERFRSGRTCPFADVAVPSGGRITCQGAFDDSQHPSDALVLGSWARGTIKIPGAVADVDNKVAGVFRANASAEWVAHARTLPDVIVATEITGGAVVFWQGLPARESVLAHVEAVR